MTPATTSASNASKLAVVEVLDRDGHARLTVPVSQWPVTIGRAIDCDVVLDDIHAAARHVTLTAGPADAGDATDATAAANVLTLVVGETVNGVQVNRRRLAAQQRAELAAGEIFQIGNTRLRVRRASDALAPERPFVSEPRRSRLATLGLFLVLMAWNVAELWVDQDPDDRIVEWLPMLILTPILLALWSLFWSVFSKLVRQRFEYLRHVRVALVYLLIVSVVAVVLPLTAFSLGWAFPSRISDIVTGLVVAALVVAHLTIILPSSRRFVTVLASLFVGAGLSLLLIYNYQVHDRVFDELYVDTLAPPAFRLAPTVETRRFIDEARDLKAILDAHAKDDDGGGSEGSMR